MASKLTPPAVSTKAESDWQAEDDHRCLTRAAEILADPKRMAGVRSERIKALKAQATMTRMVDVLASAKLPKR